MSDYSPILARLGLIILKASKYGDTKRYEMVTVKRKNGTTFQRKQLVGSNTKAPAPKKGIDKKEKIKPTPKPPQNEPEPKVKKPKAEKPPKKGSPDKESIQAPKGKRPTYLKGASPKTLVEYDIISGIRMSKKEFKNHGNLRTEKTQYIYHAQDGRTLSTNMKIMAVSTNPVICNPKLKGKFYDPLTNKEIQTLLDTEYAESFLKNYDERKADSKTNDKNISYTFEFPNNEKIKSDSVVFCYNENGKTNVVVRDNSVKNDYSFKDDNLDNLVGVLSSDLLNKLFVQKNGKAEKVHINTEKHLKSHVYFAKIEGFDDLDIMIAGVFTPEIAEIRKREEEENRRKDWALEYTLNAGRDKQIEKDREEYGKPVDISNLQWGHTLDKPLTLDEAIKNCPKGWRLPTIQELNTAYSGGEVSGQYWGDGMWSSTVAPPEKKVRNGKVTEEPNQWYRNFKEGYEIDNTEPSDYTKKSVRYVREGKQPNFPSPLKPKDGTKFPSGNEYEYAIEDFLRNPDPVVALEGLTYELNKWVKKEMGNEHPGKKDPKWARKAVFASELNMKLKTQDYSPRNLTMKDVKEALDFANGDDLILPSSVYHTEGIEADRVNKRERAKITLKDVESIYKEPLAFDYVKAYKNYEQSPSNKTVKKPRGKNGN